jgi:hypothetical protein
MQDLDEGAWFIEYDEEDETYNYFYGGEERCSLAEVYMTKDTAKKICAALNSGELQL